MPDPVEQIFLQARASTGNSNTGFEAFVSGQQGARANRALDLQERRLRLDEELHPLEAQARQMTAQHYWFDTHLKFLQAQRELNDKKAEGKMLEISLRASQSGWTKELDDEWMDVVIKNPGAAAAKIGLSIAKVRQASKALDQHKQWEESQTDLEPFGYSVNLNTGDVHKEWRRKDANARTPAGAFMADKRMNAINKLRTATDALSNAETPEEQEKAQVELTNAKDALESIDAAMHYDPTGAELKQKATGTRIEQSGKRIALQEQAQELKLKNSGFDVVSNPDGTHTLIPIARPLTAGTVTDLQKSNVKIDTALSNVGYAITQVEAHPEAFGPQGWFGQWEEKLKGMFDPNAPMPVTGARTSAGAAAHDLIISLKVDSQVSNFERHALDTVVGKPAEFWTNPAEVKKKFQVLREISAARRIRQGKELHEPLNTADLDIITDDAHVMSMAKEGTLTNEEALAWARRHLSTK